MTLSRVDPASEVSRSQEGDLIPVEDLERLPRDGEASNSRVVQLSVLSFVLGSLAWLLGPLAFVPAILCGHRARVAGREESSELELPGGWANLAGLMLGYSFLAATVAVAGTAAVGGFASSMEAWIGYCAFGFTAAAASAGFYFAVCRPRSAIYAVVMLLVGVSIVSLSVMFMLQSRREARLNDQRDRLRRSGGALQQQQDLRFMAPTGSRICKPGH